MSAIVVAITGASGSIYAETLLRTLKSKDFKIYLSISKPGIEVLRQELGWELKGNEAEITLKLNELLGYPSDAQQVTYFDNQNLNALIASGSVKSIGMIVVPCSMSTLSGIANGYASNLIERAADVTLKEARPLIVVPRETPLNQIHLRNMLSLSEMGVHIVPAMPAFYTRPQTISELSNFVVGRVLDLIKIEHNLYRRWNGHV